MGFVTFNLGTLWPWHLPCKTSVNFVSNDKHWYQVSTSSDEIVKLLQLRKTLNWTKQTDTLMPKWLLCQAPIIWAWQKLDPTILHSNQIIVYINQNTASNITMSFFIKQFSSIWNHNSDKSIMKELTLSVTRWVHSWTDDTNSPPRSFTIWKVHTGYRNLHVI